MPAVCGRLRNGARTPLAPHGVRFLIDNALPPRLAWLLTAEGHDAVHVGQYTLHDASDEKILARALAEARIVVSADTDFGTLLAAQEASEPSFILFRDANLLGAEDYFDVLRRSLSILETELAAGCVAVFRSGRLRVRRLSVSAK